MLLHQASVRGRAGYAGVRRRSDIAKGFDLLPRRWVVERTLVWLNRNRHLAEDFENTIASATVLKPAAPSRLNRRPIASRSLTS